MSDYTIRLTPSELRGRADEIEHNANTVRRELERILDEINRLRPTFIGAAASTFISSVDKSRGDFEQYDDIVRQFSDLLRMAANNLEKADQS